MMADKTGPIPKVKSRRESLEMDMGTKALLKVIDEIRTMTVEEYDALYTSAMEDVRRMDLIVGIVAVVK